jgi:phosphoribosylanthranilate isomerase
VLVKICGITRLEDALAAVELGAGAIGFLFWPRSPRFIDPFRARAIAARLPAFVTTVGVFVNQEVDYVNAVAALARLSAVQLHGDETPDDASRIARPVIKAISAGRGRDAAAWPDRVTLLVDADDPLRRGGTGTTADWRGAAALAQSRRVILAGGLTPANVGDAVASVRPFGIDVSSGVETSAGIKDRERMHALFEALHEFHHSQARS